MVFDLSLMSAILRKRLPRTGRTPSPSLGAPDRDCAGVGAWSPCMAGGDGTGCDDRVSPWRDTGASAPSRPPRPETAAPPSHCMLRPPSKSQARRMGAAQGGFVIRIFFATDVHGSDVCWKKFISAGKFYEASILILGGDMTGKAIVPIIAQGNGKYKVTLLEQETILEGRDEAEKMAATIQNRGYYPYLTDPDEVAQISTTAGRSDELFLDQALTTMRRWMAYADSKLEGTGLRCYVCPGNDDMFEIDQVIAESKHVELVEGRLIHLDDRHEMVSTGWSNPTPWDTHREEPDEARQRRVAAPTRPGG